MKSRSIRADFLWSCFWSDKNFKRRFRDVFTTKGDFNDVFSFSSWIISARKFVPLSVLMHFDRFRITLRSPNVYFDLSFSSAFGVDIKIGLFVDSDALCDQPSTISATRSGVESRSDFHANWATGYHHFCKRNVDHECTFFLRNVVNFNLYLVSKLRKTKSSGKKGFAEMYS